jgi:hypothetical protein
MQLPPTSLLRISLANGHGKKRYLREFSSYNPHVIRCVTPATVTLFHAPILLHGHTHPLYHPVYLLPHGADWVASYSALSSILDGALAMLGKPSSHQWATMFLCPLTSSFSCNQSLTNKPLDLHLAYGL